MVEQRFETFLQAEEGGSGFFVEVPAAVVAALGSRQRPPVRVTLNGYAYRTTIAVYGGRYFLPVRREIRAAAGLAAGAAVAVGIALDEEPRLVALPDDFRLALEADPPARAAFDSLAAGHRGEYVAWIVGAKRAATRQRRIARAVMMLKAGQRQP